MTDESGKAITEHAANPTSLSKLAEHMGVGKSAMSITVKKLVRKGYVRSIRDKNDARRIGLTLTATGARAKEQNTILDPELMKKMFRLMSASAYTVVRITEDGEVYNPIFRFMSRFAFGQTSTMDTLSSRAGEGHRQRGRSA